MAVGPRNKQNDYFAKQNHRRGTKQDMNKEEILTSPGTVPLVPPVLVGVLSDFTTETANLPDTLDVSGGATGQTSYLLVGAPTGVTINSSGVINFSAAVTAQDDTAITVRYVNADGFVEQPLTFTVEESNTDIQPVNSANIVFITNMDPNGNDISGNGLTVDNASASFSAKSSGNATPGNRVAVYNARNDVIHIDPMTSDLQFPGDFCVEGWFYPTGDLGSQFSGLFGSKFSTTSGPDGSFAVYRRHNNSFVIGLRIVQQDGSGFDVSVDGGISLNEDTAYHVAFVRDGSTVKVYVNGVEDISVTYTGTIHSELTGELYIGGNDVTTTQHFLGEVGPVRITKGEPVYTGAFTPPANIFPVP